MRWLCFFSAKRLPLPALPKISNRIPRESKAYPDLPHVAGQIKASAKQQKNIRRNSVPSVSLGCKAFPPKCAEATECRRKDFGRMI